jgi:hypothetical protein
MDSGGRFLLMEYLKLYRIMLILICFLSIFFLPSIAEAWGPLTHVYLGYQVLDVGAAIVPASIYALLKKYKNDFLYGNLSADIILGKRFQVYEKNSHNWDTAWELFRSANTDQQKAFAYGYLTHLSADTVVHNLKKSILPFTHSILEIKADNIVDKKYGKMLKGLDKIMQKKNDVLLENMLESVFFSFKTNKKIFKSFLFLSRLHNYSPVVNFIDKRLPHEIPVVDIYKFQQESLNRMFELLKDGKNSEVLKKNPLIRNSFRKRYYNGG